MGDKENATLVAEGIFPCECYSPFDAANRQTLRYANRGGGIFAKEEHAISHSRIHSTYGMLASASRP